MRTLGDLKLVTEAAAPHHTGAYAAAWMEDLASSAMPVAENGLLLGIVARADAHAHPSRTVAELLQPLALALESDLDLKEAARRMAEASAPAAGVVREGQMLGLASMAQVIAELSVSRDALTGLPWSDLLRNWGAARLQHGQEITLLLFDLDSFGRYNKQYGHVVGDRVLQAFVAAVEPLLDPGQDVFVRYGGDEFVFCTVRPRAAAEQVMAALTGMKLAVDGVEEAVTFSIGISGGKRTAERTATHYAATLDNLINLASKDCLARKAVAANPSEDLRRAEAKAGVDAGSLGQLVYTWHEGKRAVKVLAKDGRELASADLGDSLEDGLAEALRRARMAG